MAEVVENQEKIFKHYLELPEKIRMFVIDEQEPDDRVRFTRCSKICNQEAKASKNYVYGLNFEVMFANNDLQIQVLHGKRHGYTLYFIVRNSEEIEILCYSLAQENQFIWRETWTTSESVFQFAFEEFMELLHTYQSKIKKLEILGNAEDIRWSNIDFEIENLDKIEDLMFYVPVDIQKLFSKIRHPLKRLCVSGNSNIILPKNYEQIMQVWDLTWTRVELDSEQLQRLPASYVEIGLGKLTERDIFKFIRSWQDGTIGKKIARYAWHYSPSTFNWRKLLRLLRLPEEEEIHIEIKHFTEYGKCATLYVSDGYMRFSER